MMRNIIIVVVVLLIIKPLSSSGQEIKISDGLSLSRLTEHTFIHHQDNNNGLVFIHHGKAVIVSTPASDTETQNLIDWVRNQQHAKIVGYIIDRWHPDAMEGLDVVHRNGIKSYAYERTRQIAREKGLPVPETGFNPKLIMDVGGAKVICHFLGESHTTDGIVVWIPDEHILFGGNGIRNNHGWVGNIGDANLEQWPLTATRIKQEYGDATIVIPGHGQYGGPELIDYTIHLYQFPRHHTVQNDSAINFDEYLNKQDSYFKAGSDLVHNGKRMLKDVLFIAQDATKYVQIESPSMMIQTGSHRVDSPAGRLRIYDKTNQQPKLRTDVDYKKLIMLNADQSVGWVVILKEITNSHNLPENPVLLSDK